MAGNDDSGKLFVEPEKLLLTLDRKVNRNVTEAVLNRQLGSHKGSLPIAAHHTAEDKLVHKENFEEMVCEYAFCACSFL